MDGIGTKTFTISNHDQGTCVTRPELIFYWCPRALKHETLGDDQGLHRPTGWQHRQVPKNHPELQMYTTGWIYSAWAIFSLGQFNKYWNIFTKSATFNANVRPIFFSYALPEFCDYKEFTTKTEIILHPMAFHRVKVRNHRPWPHVICSKISWSLGSF